MLLDSSVAMYSVKLAEGIETAISLRVTLPSFKLILWVETSPS